jgi:PAS domain S-box-containing protein
MRDAGGRVAGYIAIGRDITAQKRTEEKLRESEVKFREIFSNINDAVQLHEILPDGRPGRFLDVNDAACRMLGVTRDELLAHNPLDYATEYHNPPLDEVTLQLRTGGSATFETGHRRADGSVVPVEINAHVIKLMGKTVVLSVIRDLTYRKKAEEELRISNVILSTQQETSPDGILIVDENAKIINFNQSFVRIMEIPADLIASRDDEPVLQHVVGQCADPEAFLSRVRYLYDHKEEKSHEEIRLKNGMVLERYSAPMLGEDNRYFGRVWYFHDISERKRVEEALRESEKKYRTLFENMLEGFAYCRMIYDEKGMPVDWVYLDVNKAFGQLTGLHNITGKPVLEAIPGIREQTPGLFDTYGRVASTGKPETFEIDFKPLKQWLKVSVFSPEKGYFVAVFEDVTERNRAESALRESRQILEGILNTIPVRVFWKDKKLTYLGCNTPFARDAGFERPEDVIGRDDYSMGWRDQAELYRADDRAVIESGKPKLMIEEPQTTPAGETIYLLTSKLPLLDARGDAIGVLGTYLDITERRKAEAQLQESRQLFSDIISFLPDPTFVIDRDGTVLAWNRAIELLSGVSAGDIIGKGDYAYSHWLYGKRRPILIDLVLYPDQDAARLNYYNIQWEGRTITAQTDIISPGSSHMKILSLVASPLLDSQGKITGAIESMRDITHIKETEAELFRINQNLETIVQERTRALEEEVAQRMRAENDVQDALSYTRSVIEANPDLMVVLDGTGTVLDVNAAAEILTGMPRGQLIGTQYFRYLVDDGTHADAFSRLLEQGRIEKIIQISRKDAHIIPLAINATIIAGSTGTDTRIIVSGHDITRQKQDEAAIQASLDEKVILLREVHHRVKNNLQIIISLTNLQMRQTGDPTVKQIMAETQNRVRAMSLVHEKLYRSESLSHIDFADYIRFLATQLFSFYGMDTQRVRLDISMEKIMVDINTAVPLGLLMNELVSNALKHAFPDGREGMISISGGEEGNRITLFVRDNGIGIPESLDWKNTTTLGMRLVTSLIDQIDGTIVLDRDHGTLFTITVPGHPVPGGG